MESWAALADRELVALTLRGRPDAYGELVRRHQSAVYNVVYRLIGDRQDALDLAQDTFVRAYRALGSFDTAPQPRCASRRSHGRPGCRACRSPPSIPRRAAMC